MLFNSYEFLFVFLPLALAGYVYAVRFSRQAGVLVLTAASVFFYAFWEAKFAPLLLATVIANYFIGSRIDRPDASRRLWLIFGVTANLALLGYYKYTNFLLGQIDAVAGTHLNTAQIVLPIGISFFTFQQIAYLVDIYRSEPAEKSFSRYALFVTFFPHLIAGPLTHHREMMPQFGLKRASRLTDLATGLTLLVIGLVKKLLIADTVAVPSTQIFSATAGGLDPTLVEAWIAALCYTLQIYFDFSAYSDMAVGLGRMFGIELPINFASPYKATSIIDFWRRWHITLSRFLRDYLYISLGGNRVSPWRQKFNVFLTMLLGGLWHGAGWTYIVWGAMHGTYLFLNHLWSASDLGKRMAAARGWKPVAAGLTFFCVVFAWVPFRAADMTTTVSMWRGMVGMNGVVLPPGIARRLPGLESLGGEVMGYSIEMMFYLVCLLGIAFFAPNAYEIMRNARLGLGTKGYPQTYITPDDESGWRLRPAFALAVGLGLALAIVKLGDVSEFIYFQF